MNDTSLKRSTSNDRLDANPREDIDESWERKEAEKREQEWRDEIERREAEYKAAQQRKYDGSSKIIGFLQIKLQAFINIDYQKKLLSYHASFNSMKLFDELDVENKGHVTSENF